MTDRPIARYHEGRLERDYAGCFWLKSTPESLKAERAYFIQLDPKAHRENINQINQALEAYARNHETL